MKLGMLGAAAAAALWATMAGLAGARAADEVKLVYASSVVMSDYHWSTQYAQFDAVVKDAECADSVVIHLDAGGGWSDVPALRVSGAGPGRSVYRAHHAIQYTPHEIRFAVRCGAGARTYWDNNGARDYTLSPAAGGFLTSSNVYDFRYTAEVQDYGDTDTYSGSIVLRNLGYAKEVTIVYTTDDWQTVNEARATYHGPMWGYYTSTPNPNALGFEVWDFILPVGDASSVEYAIAYTVNGQTYWDNNFGQNYVTQLVR